MYRAKEGGRARCVLFDAEMRARRDAPARDRTGAAARARPRRAGPPLPAGGQPALRRDHRARGAGALAPPRAGHCSTRLEFVSIAEDSGLIEPIGRWVQERACRQVARVARAAARRASLRRRGQPLGSPGRPPRPAGDGRRDHRPHRPRPVHLRLEITESVLVEESATAIASLEALNELGVRLVLDDFGTGYSSLAYLNRFPFHALKIDRSFVDGLGIEQERTAIVEAIIGMARALSLEVIAEGVESEVQLAELRRLGCDYAQGHLFHAAMPAARGQPADRRRGARLFGDLACRQVVVARAVRSARGSVNRSGRCRASSRRRSPTPAGSM